MAAVGAGGARARAAVAALVLPQWTCADGGVENFDAVFQASVGCCAEGWGLWRGSSCLHVVCGCWALRWAVHTWQIIT